MNLVVEKVVALRTEMNSLKESLLNQEGGMAFANANKPIWIPLLRGNIDEETSLFKNAFQRSTFTPVVLSQFARFIVMVHKPASFDAGLSKGFWV